MCHYGNVKNIKRNDFVTLKSDTKSVYGTTVFPAGTKCRVWKAQRTGMLSMSTAIGHGTLVVHRDAVTLVAAPKPTVKVGDIFCCEWGYEQTNVDFYRISAVTGSSVKYVKIGGSKTCTGPMQGTTMPIVNSVGTNEKTARIRVDGDGAVSFKISSYSAAYPWPGTPVFYSEWH